MTRHKKSLCVVLALAFVVGNARRLINFAQFGRGGQSRAIARIIATSKTQPPTVTGENAFRTQSVIEFSTSRIQFDGGAESPAEWFIATKPTGHPDRYVLDSTYRAGELSGTDWWLYRRSDNER